LALNGGAPTSLAHVRVMIPADKRHYLNSLDGDSQMGKG
jgi:hypothetical protein